MKQPGVILICLLILVACSDRVNSSVQKKAIPLKYAENFRLDSLQNGLMLTIGEKSGRKRLFYLSNIKPASVPSGAIWVQTPVKRILTLAGTDIGMLARIGEEDRICGVLNGSTVYNRKVLSGINAHRITDFRQQNQLPFERILLSKAGVITYSDFGKDFPHGKELAQANVICIPILDWKERHPLGKAEWMKVYGYLCGNYRKAEALFINSSAEYTKLISGGKFKIKPTVFTGNQTGEIWFCPAGQSYEAQLIADAGGDYRYKSTRGTGSLSLAPEKVITDNRHSQLWINPGIASKRDLQKKQPRAELFDAFKQNTVFCYSANMNQYWETAACHPEKLLSDLISIFHRKDPKELYFYRQLK